MKFYWQKLHFCGIQGVYEDWLRPYLTNKRQKVEVKSPFLPDWLYIETWNSPRMKSRASIVHNICKLPSPENLFCIRTSIIC